MNRGVSRRGMRIGLDVDEVLAEFLRGMLPWLEEHYGLDYSWYDMHTYEFYKAWHIPYGEAREYIEAYLESDTFESLDAVPGSREGVASLAENHSLVIITSRPRSTREETVDWLHSVYGDVFDEVLVTNGHGEGESRSKASYVSEYNVDVHVDDNPSYCENIVSETQARAVLCSKPWNVDKEVDRRVARVDSWDDIRGVVEWESKRV